MMRLETISCVVPPNEIGTDETLAFLVAHAPDAARERLRRLVERSRNRARHSVLPLSRLARLGGATERSALYREHASRLAARALEQIADLGRLSPREISTVVFVSGTGFVAPSIETDLMRRFAIRPDARRVALAQLGCGGGVAALALAADLARGKPGKALVISAEVPSLQLQLAEPSYRELAAAAQFGDGAAAALVSCDGRGPEILGTETVLLPEVEEGGRVFASETGLRLSGSSALPAVVRARVGELVRGFTERHGVDADRLAFVAAHPRSPEVLEAVADGLALPPASLAGSWSAWERNANMISASVFFALAETARTHSPREGDLGALLAFGTGLACEMALLRWDRPPEIAFS